MTQNINVIPNEPGLQDLLVYYKKLTKLEINCHHVGTITAFDATNQTAQATINYTKTFLRVDEIGDTSVTPTNYAQLIDCPVVCLGGGGGSLTFPIVEGDECLVLFNDRDFDNWFSSGNSNAAPATPRAHGFSDAIILVGIRSIPNVITEYDTDAAAFRYLENGVRIYEDRVEITVGDPAVVFILNSSGKLEITNATGEFVAALSQLFADIQAATTNTVFGPQPLIMPTFVTDVAVFNSFKV